MLESVRALLRQATSIPRGRMSRRLGGAGEEDFACLCSMSSLQRDKALKKGGEGKDKGLSKDRGLEKGGQGLKHSLKE